ncbi:MAG: hypothetical protein DI529_02475 [Chryseobacterium sp.]|nr:MAG: hypothetical protein DI529_02475 [Chryseobacterium sp.]
MKKIKYLVFIFIIGNAFAQKHDSLKIIAEKQIQEVVITGKKPVLETKSDRFVFNVENTGLVIGNNAWNVLQQTPLLMVDDDNGISVMGFQTAVVYINGRKSILLGKDLYGYLKSMPADNLIKIEIITTPSSKYDANDGAVIDLILKKMEDDGWKGSISFTDKQTRKNSQEIMAYLNYHRSRYSQSSTFDIGVDRRKSYEYNINKIYNALEEQYIDTDRKTEEYYIGINNSFEYEINPENSIGGILELNYSNPKTFLFSKNYSDNSHEYFTNQDDNYKNVLFSNNLFYKFQGKKSNRNLEINLDWVYRKSNGDGNYNSYDNTLINAYNNSINEERRNYSLKVDYSQSLGNSGYSIETGFKNNFLSQHSPYYVNSWNGMEYIPNSNLTNIFKYKENILGIYTTISKTYFKKLTIKAGLRSEFTNIDGIQILTDEVNKMDYNNWLPTIIVSYKANDKNTIALSYKKSIIRPYANEINPFIYYINDNYIHKGNPSLGVYKQEIYRLNYSFRKNYNLTLAYKINNDVMRSSYYYQNNQLVIQTINYRGNNYQFFVGLNINKSIIKDKLSVNFNPSFTFNDNSEINRKNDLNVPNSTFSNFDLKVYYKNILNTGINSEAYFSFYNNFSLVNYKLTEASNRFTFSLSRNFDKQGVKIRLETTDPFNFLTWKTVNYSNIGEIYRNNRRDIRSITLSISKSFGNKKSKETNKQESDKGRVEEGNNSL